jgi:pimeloyl-ACP methyl ester carboxylesterase
VNSVGDIQLAGVSLANFINYLGKKYHIKQVDLVAHSMGGLYSTSAIKYLRDTRSKVKVRSLTAIGSPWQGTPFANPMDANDKFSGCDGQLACINLIKVFGNAAPVVLVELERKQRDALNNYNAGVLDDIPVTLIAGNAFAKKMGI